MIDRRSLIKDSGAAIAALGAGMPVSGLDALFGTSMSAALLLLMLEAVTRDLVSPSA